MGVTAGGSRNFSGIQIGDRENEIVVVPIKMSAIDREFFEPSLVEILSDGRMMRLAEEGRVGSSVEGPHERVSFSADGGRGRDSECTRVMTPAAGFTAATGPRSRA